MKIRNKINRSHFSSALFLCVFLFVSQYTVGQNTSVVSNEFIFENPPFTECHASSIEATPDGLLATWFAGSKEANSDVEIWLSSYRDGKWSNPKVVADGIQYENKRYACWNPVLFQAPNGPLLLFYKVGLTPSSWWGMLKKSYDGGLSWSKAERLPEGVLGPIKNKPFMTADGRLICPSSTEESPNHGWRIHFEITPNLGETWYVSPSVEDVDSLNAIQPSILSYKNGDALQAIGRSKDGGTVSSWSYDNGRTWSKLSSLALPNPNSGTDAVTLKNGLQVIVYNHSEKSKNRWTGKRTPLNLAFSVDGIVWDNLITLESEEGEFSYPAVIEDSNGLIHITYTWKRKKIKHVVVDPAVVLTNNPSLSKKLKEYLSSNSLSRAIPVIFDTDMGNDVDDVLALAMLYNYQKIGRANILGITINKANTYSIPFIDIMNRTYKFPAIPIGFIGDEGPTKDEGKYLRPVVEDKKKNGKFTFKRKLNTESKLPEAWKLQRKLLAAQEDNSVVLISVGFSSNLYKLLQSKADEFSLLSGYELVRTKVKLLSVMAGNFADKTKAEYNVVKDVASAKYVFENWPTEAVFAGWEVGAAIKCKGDDLLKSFKEPDPLLLAYKSFQKMPYDRECWDLISVFFVFENWQNFLEKSEWGRVDVKEKGNIVFVPQINGTQQYLKLIDGQQENFRKKITNLTTGKEYYEE